MAMLSASTKSQVTMPELGIEPGGLRDVKRDPTRLSAFVRV
jgi:hypothetical protein